MGVGEAFAGEAGSPLAGEPNSRSNLVVSAFFVTFWITPNGFLFLPKVVFFLGAGFSLPLRRIPRRRFFLGGCSGSSALSSR